jgi:hypothetical protein
MSITRKAKRVKPARHVRLFPAPAALAEVGAASVLVIKEGKRTDVYSVKAIASDFGQGFEVRKLTGEEDAVYHVLLEREGKSCDCVGHLRYGYCRHATEVARLVESGELEHAVCLRDEAYEAWSDALESALPVPVPGEDEERCGLQFEDAPPF